MDEKEVRIKCIDYAFRYADYLAKVSGTLTYKTEAGIVSLASRFEHYVKNGN